MNKLERDYAMILEAKKRTGEIREWAYESFRLKLADGAWFTPDFFVVCSDDLIEFHETKGFMREAARVRLLVAAQMYPFAFKLVKRTPKGWTITEVAP